MTNRSNRSSTFRVTLSALLLSMMLILGYVESLIPINAGIPGIKLGLSNGVLIFAVYMLDIPTGFTLMALKVLLSGIMFAGPSTMMYGFAGGLLSLAGMSLLSRLKRLPSVVVSAVGGILHNAGQIGMSLLILQVPFKAMLVYLLVLTLIGAACGFLTGLCATSVMKHLRSAGWTTAKAPKRGLRGWVIAVAVVVAVGGACLWFLRQAAPAGEPDAPSVEWSSDLPDGAALPGLPMQ